jgi:cardiolipin synthase
VSETLTWLPVVLSLAHILLSVAAILVISARRRPTTAIAWALLIIFVPYLGALAFFLVGFSRLPRRRREKQREVSQAILDRTEGLDRVGHRDEWPDWLASTVRLNERLGALPMVGGTRAALIDDYDASIAAMVADIDTAERYVHVEFYILALDTTTEPFFAALERATARGVTVRVLSDHLMSVLSSARKDTLGRLAAMGAEWHGMLPLRPLKGQWQRPDLRNHRKLLVVDGRVGHTGSQNMIASHYGKKKAIRRGLRWKELMVRLEGPVVRELDAVFVTDWFSETDELLPLDTSPVVLPDDPTLLDAQVLPSGPSFENDNNLKLYTTLIHKAEKQVSITSPYFVPDESIQLAIITAATRGLLVELYVSEIGDQFFVYHAQRSYYEDLLRAGVRIYLYQAPTVLHSKHFTIDDDIAVVGSSNMDIRSFSLNMEVSVLVHGAGFVDGMRAIEASYRASSRELTLDEWMRRPWGEKARDSLARLTSSLQ